MAKAIHFVILFCGLVSIYGLPTNSDDDTKEGHYAFDPERVGLLDAVPKRSFVDLSEDSQQKDALYSEASSASANINVVPKIAIPRNMNVEEVKRGTSRKKSSVHIKVLVHVPKEHPSKKETILKTSAHESKKDGTRKKIVAKRSASESKKGRQKRKTITKRSTHESKKNPSKKGKMTKRSIYQPKKHGSKKVAKRSVHESKDHSVEKTKNFIPKSKSKRQANELYFPMSSLQGFPAVQDPSLQYLTPLDWASTMNIPGVKKDELSMFSPPQMFAQDLQPVKKTNLEIEVSNTKSTNQATNLPVSNSIVIPLSGSTILRKDILENSTSTNTTANATLPTSNKTENFHTELKNASKVDGLVLESPAAPTVASVRTSNTTNTATNTTNTANTTATNTANTTFASNSTSEDYKNQTRHDIALGSNDNKTSTSDNKSDEFPATEDGLLQMTHNILSDFTGFQENVNDLKEATVSRDGDKMHFQVDFGKSQQVKKKKRSKIPSSKTSVNQLTVSLSKNRFEDYLVSRFMTYVCGKEC